MRTFHLLLLSAFLPVFALPPSALAWSQPHQAITKAALERLPTHQKAFLGEELALLGENYCLIPDNVFTDRANAKFAMLDDKPKEIYRLNLHLPAQQPENLETLRYFLEKAVSALQAQNVKDGARYMGTICHQIEDYGSPSHTMPGDNMFTLLQQFLPPSEGMKDKLLHSPVESGELTVTIPGYQPKLLGTTVNEAAWRLLHRIHEGIINARSTTIPIIQALYAEDPKTVEYQQLRAATTDAQIVADALFTILSLGTRTTDELEASAEGAALTRSSISKLFPLEAASLYFPQSQFFSSPHWGHARSGVILAEGKRALPLKLRVQTADAVKETEFPEGISAGMGRSLTFLLPAGVYSRFTVLAGLHPELGAQGNVEFTISGDGKTLATGVVSGAEPAKAIDCAVSGVSELQLALSSKGGDPKSNYAIWADPVLLKH
jgi:NPCBM/NEW2 domain